MQLLCAWRDTIMPTEKQMATPIPSKNAKPHIGAITLHYTTEHGNDALYDFVTMNAINDLVQKTAFTQLRRGS